MYLWVSHASQSHESGDPALSNFGEGVSYIYAYIF